MKKTLIFISFLFNFAFIAFLALSLNGKPSSVAFPDFSTDSQAYTTGACIISVPSEGADIVFGVPEFSLKAGSEASFQFSLVSAGKKQVNLALEAIYDRTVISTEPSGYGITIRGLLPGETILQQFTNDGIKNIVKITVTP